MLILSKVYFKKYKFCQRIANKTQNSSKDHWKRQLSANNHQKKPVIFAKELQKRHNLHQRIAEKTCVSSKDHSKNASFFKESQCEFHKRIVKKHKFWQRTMKKYKNFVKEAWKKIKILSKDIRKNASFIKVKIEISSKNHWEFSLKDHKKMRIWSNKWLLKKMQILSKNHIKSQILLKNHMKKPKFIKGLWKNTRENVNFGYGLLEKNTNFIAGSKKKKKKLSEGHRKKQLSLYTQLFKLHTHLCLFQWYNFVLITANI